ncbi:MAG TPA: 23S rRNA (adenine(2503)-C(2))-methyltransferase RlmN [Candidatus Polarisedimenticolia bacterium]|nr:23S rRNA (adenine(2503)-C(2))-methyltransferase RlmN [Candidatus Polarisedimenticolia bacterium]
MNPSPDIQDIRLNLFGLDREGLREALTPLTARRFHADQVFHWIYGRRETDPRRMSDLPAALRAAIDDRFRFAWPRTRVSGRSADGSRKHLLTLEDGLEIEAVHMVHADRVTFCLSSQVGCALDCAFCLTGTMGLRRQLGAGEIAGQVAALLADGEVPIDQLRIVFMGMGEPLHNYDAVMAAFRILVDPQGFALPPRRITLSTAGLVPGIERLGREDPRPRLAVSLAAPTDAARARLMPINRKWTLAKLLAACRAFPLGPRERITFEYVLLAGVNDSAGDAEATARLLAGLRAKVNVIPYNEAGLHGFATPAAAVAARFRDVLLRRGMQASIRWSKGRDIGAACGQLARTAASAS